MEEELNYATVVFKNGGSPQKENDEDSTIYSTVKSKVPAATGTTKAAGGGAAGGGGAADGGAAGGGAAGGAAAAHSRHFVLLLVCLGILCVLLMACIGVIIYICGVMKAQEAVAENVIHLEKENQRLMMEKEILANKTEVLTLDRDDLNRTLGVIMTFQNFPVSEFCPDKKCQPCRESWIPFQDHCYLFYDQSSWKTWKQARTICQNPVGDLVVVDSLQEQGFINNHTKFYYDKYHGYWMGLSQNEDNKWIWIDGRNETEGYWNQTKVDLYTGGYAMTFPGKNATASWGPAKCTMRNKFICEHEALVRTPVR